MDEQKEQMSTIDQELYQKALDSKKHYDNLSWLIGGALLFLFAGIINKIGDIPNCDLWSRILLLLGALVALLAWYLIYNRNRFWTEVANETMKVIEKKYRVEGIAIKFMKAAVSKTPNSRCRLWLTLELINKDENGDQWAPNGQAKCWNIPMHKIITVSLVVFAILAIAYTVIPYLKSSDWMAIWLMPNA